MPKAKLKKHISSSKLDKKVLSTIDYEAAYRICPYPSATVVRQLSRKHGVRPKSVQLWFYRRRRKDDVRWCLSCIRKDQKGQQVLERRCSCLTGNSIGAEKERQLRVRVAPEQTLLCATHIKTEPVEFPVPQEHPLRSVYIKLERVDVPRMNDHFRVNDPRMNPVVMLQRIHLMCGSPLCQRCKGTPSH